MAAPGAEAIGGPLLQFAAALLFWGLPVLSLVHAYGRDLEDWAAVGRSRAWWIAIHSMALPVGLGPLVAATYVVLVPTIRRGSGSDLTNAS